MALYDFYCNSCDKNFEAIIKIGTEVGHCPTCNLACSRSHVPVKCEFSLLGQMWSRDGYESRDQHQNTLRIESEKRGEE